jgi:hypothetical protein
MKIFTILNQKSRSFYYEQSRRILESAGHKIGVVNFCVFANVCRLRAESLVGKRILDRLWGYIPPVVGRLLVS